MIFKTRRMKRVSYMPSRKGITNECEALSRRHERKRLFGRSRCMMN
jgi:hypothetical protein